MIGKFLARQFRNPSWGFGQFVLAPLWNKRNAVLNDTAFQRLDLQPQDRLLEIGFGGGYLLGKTIDVLTNSHISGIDISSAMVDYCQIRYREDKNGNTIDLRKAVAENIPFPSTYFTKVCSVNSIFYWNNIPQAFSEIRRTLKNKGLFVLCFTVKEYLEQKRFAKEGLRLFQIDEIHTLLIDSGFSDVDITRHKDRYREFWCVGAASY